MMRTEMRILKIGYLILFILLFTICISPVWGQEGYPIPQKTDNLLFYFQRSHNKNTIVYDLNTLPDGTINRNKPINIYWIRFEEGGVKKELSYFQQKAFGLQWRLTDKVNDSYLLHFNNFKKRDIYLLKDNEQNIYKAYITINGELAVLTKMYMQSENNSFGIPLSVKYVELSGINLKSGKNVIERYFP